MINKKKQEAVVSGNLRGFRAIFLLFVTKNRPSAENRTFLCGSRLFSAHFA